MRRVPFHTFWANTLLALQPLVSSEELACIRRLLMSLVVAQKLPVSDGINPSLWCWDLRNGHVPHTPYLAGWFQSWFPSLDHGKLMDILLDPTLYPDGLPRLAVIKRGNSYCEEGDPARLIHCQPIFGLPQQVYHQHTLELLDEFWGKHQHPSCSLEVAMYGARPEGA